MGTEREREMLDDLARDFRSGRLDGVRRPASTDMVPDSFWDNDFDREFTKTTTFIKRAWLAVFLVMVFVMVGLAALAVVLLSHFNVI